MACASTWPMPWTPASCETWRTSAGACGRTSGCWARPSTATTGAWPARGCSTRPREFADFAWQGEVPDPHGEDTFRSACLSWSWPEGTTWAGLRRLYADLLAARREWPALRDFTQRTARLLPDV